ncbi:BTAD domain-containing putative transcriptional regulator [Gordonia caeni]|uniref:BTAD domain-containing putative transcriptional regulator n=1 Tax=Gordonia caeni TaxID=1007097 RepID=A0ABP7NY96_9ACTN
MAEVASDDRGPAMIGVLGPVEVDGQSVPGIRAQRLLTSLVLAGGAVRSADRLIDDVWEGEPPRSPHSALHTQISRLRRHLGAAEITGSGGGYRLDGADSDLARAERLVGAADPDSTAHARSLWRGVPGDGLGADSEVARELRVRTDSLAHRIDQRWAHDALAGGDYDTARAVAEARCAADPLAEDAHLLLMRALAGQGHRAEALAVFATLRRTLAAELGIDPGPEITALNTELLTTPAASPVRRPPPRPSGLRAEATPLIGRDDDVTAIERLLGEHRVVTVLGPGGIGKTRIANAAGLRAESRGDTVWWVPLASVRNDDDVAAALAGALGVGEADVSGTGRLRTTVSEITALLAEAVAGRRSVMILDNCEQVIDGTARLVDELVAAAGELTVLITSRSPLMIAAEQTYQLPVLATDGSAPAVELFLQRARAVRESAPLDRQRVAELCEYLDGLPLAIELAAARIRTMSVEEITARLVERFTLLRSTDRTAPDRHRTLHAVIEWSWDLLTPAAQRLMTRTCRFAGGFDASAAALTGGVDGAELDDALTALVNQSLLQVIDDGPRVRYRMMEMVREFGEERLAADDAESAAVNAAMVAWACALCERLRRQVDEAVDRGLVESVTADVENLVWVLRLALAAEPADIDTVVHLFPVLAAWWSVRGLHAEIGAWGGRILETLGTPPEHLDEASRERWQLTVIAAGVPMLMQESTRRIAHARATLRRLHRPELTMERPADFLSGLAVAHNGIARIRLLERAADHSGGDVGLLALGLRTNVRENAGNLVGAMRDGARLGAAGARDPWIRAMNQLSTGSLHSQQGQWAQSIPHFQAAVDGLDGMGATDDAVQARYFLAIVLVATGDLIGAERLLESVCEFDPDGPLPQGDPESVASQAICWASLRTAQGAEATDLWRGAAELLLADYRPHRSDPGVNVLLASTVCGLALAGHGGHAQTWLPALAQGLCASIANQMWRDIPQIGSSTLAVGLLLSREPETAYQGALLLASADRFRVRRDYPAIDDALRRRRSFSGVDDRTWESIVRHTEASSRRRLMEEIAGLLEQRFGEPVR